MSGSLPKRNPTLGGGGEVLLLNAWFPSKVMHREAGAMSRGLLCGDLYAEGWKWPFQLLQGWVTANGLGLFLSTSAAENQVGSCPISVSVNKGAQKLTTQWLPFPSERLFQAGFCRCCRSVLLPAKIGPSLILHYEDQSGEETPSTDGEMKQTTDLHGAPRGSPDRCLSQGGI